LSPNTHRFAAQLEAVNAMNDPVEKPSATVADLAVPLCHRHPRGEHQRSRRSSRIYQKSRASVSLERRHRPIIHHDHVDLAQPEKEVPQASIGSPRRQTAE